jgi:3',5'-cyclic AMP phosphodiesterase CpdA
MHANSFPHLPAVTGRSGAGILLSVISRALLAGLLGGGAFAQPSEPWFFVQLTDPQFGMHTGDKAFDQETANFEFAVASVNRWKPAFVIITGDLINKPGDPAQVAEYLRIEKKIDPTIRVYHLAGNHDVENAPTPAALAAYRKTFGPDWYSFRQGSFAGVIINTSIIHSPQHVADELAKQRGWLEAELDRLKRDGATHIVLFQHHPWFTVKASEPDGYFNLPLSRRDDYLKLLARYGVKQAFGGHIHRNAVAEDMGVEMISTGPVGMPLSEEGSGLRVGIVRNGKVEHKFYQLNALPNMIPMK